MPKTVDPQDVLQAVGTIVGETRREMRAEMDAAIKQSAGGDGHTDLVRASMKTMGGHLHEQKQLLVSVRRSLDAMGRGIGKASMSPRAVLVKAVAARLIAADSNSDPVKVAEELYKSPRVVDAVRDPATAFKSITNPAMTTVGGWAAELMQVSSFTGLLPSLAPTSVYASLLRRGIDANIGRMAGVRFPAREPPASIPQIFVSEGEPIAVRALAFSESPLITPHKAAVISLLTAEIARYSTPAAELVIDQALNDDISVALDTALLDDNVASTSRPAGLLESAIEVPASTAADPATAAAEDIAGLVSVIQPSALNITFITGAAQATALGLYYPGGVDVIVTDTLAPGVVIAIDASDFVGISQEGGTITITEDAAVVSRDNPVPVSEGGVAGTPISSLWQMNLLGIRVVEFVGWGMRRANRVAVTTTTIW